MPLGQARMLNSSWNSHRTLLSKVINSVKTNDCNTMNDMIKWFCSTAILVPMLLKRWRHTILYRFVNPFNRWSRYQNRQSSKFGNNSVENVSVFYASAHLPWLSISRIDRFQMAAYSVLTSKMVVELREGIDKGRNPDSQIRWCEGPIFN